MGIRATKIRVAVEKSQTGPESKRGCFAQIFHRTPVGFCIKLNNILLLTSPNFGGSFKEIFK